MSSCAKLADVQFTSTFIKMCLSRKFNDDEEDPDTIPYVVVLLASNGKFVLCKSDKSKTEFVYEVEFPQWESSCKGSSTVITHLSGVSKQQSVPWFQWQKCSAE